MSLGYIYVRTNEYWDMYDAYKLGKTSSIPDREQTYITSEIKKGFYVMVIELNLSILDNIEKQLQLYFNSLNFHIKFNGGMEYYNKQIINYIIPYLHKNNVSHKILSNEEINNLIKKIRDDNYYENDYENDYHKCNNKDNSDNDIQNITNMIENTHISDHFIPRDYQNDIINKSIEYFKNNNKGLLVIPCGVGKTLISLWIAQQLNSKTILIGVPNNNLLDQWEKVVYDLFYKIPILTVSGNISIDKITQFLENNKKCIVITTYASSYKVYKSTQSSFFIFNMKINDETHHLTSNNLNEDEKRTYVQMLKINSYKQLSLTATLKLIENKENVREDEIIVSNDNIEHFGEIIERKSLLWAINEKIICDYLIQTIITDEEKLEDLLLKFNIIEENDKRLFLSAYASLKSIYDYHSHHLLIYSNNKDNSLKLVTYIKMLLDDNYFDIHNLYYSNYHSDMKSKEQREIINNFDKAKFGIITCVYCLGEGYDNHNIDAVVFAENMSSNIRIVQSALRASRKNKLETNKITKIILPILNRDDWLDNNNNPDLKKVREVIYQMSLEDETITQKIKVFRINIEKPKSNNIESLKKDNINPFGLYDDELTLKLRLKTVKRIALSISYQKAIKIIADKNIKNKESYYELCDIDSRLSKEPEIVFKDHFTNWIDYLSILRIYYDLETCKNKIMEYLSLYPELKNYYLNLTNMSNKLCELDKLFPPYGLWIDYYNVKDLRDIIIINNTKKKNGITS